MTRADQKLTHISKQLGRFATSVLLWFIVTVTTFVTLFWLNHSGIGTKTFGKGIWLDGYAIGSNLLLALLSSFGFYFLVVYVPARRRRVVLRNSQLRLYRLTKRDIVIDILQASRMGGRLDLECDSDTIDRLMSPAQFRAAFEGGHESDEGFYAFLNGIQSDKYLFDGLVFKFRLVARQVNYLSHMAEIHDEESLIWLRRIELRLYQLETLNAEYDGVKQFGNAVFEIMADWSMIEGYRKLDGHDVVERAIRAI